MRSPLQIADRAPYLAERGAVDPVVNIAAHLLALDDAGSLENGEVMRNRRLRKAQLRRQLRNVVNVEAFDSLRATPRGILRRKELEDAQAHPIGQRFELAGEQVVGQLE